MVNWDEFLKKLFPSRHFSKKYTEAIILYAGRYLPKVGIHKTDVRSFFVNPVCHELQIIDSARAFIDRSFCDDQKAYLALQWVQKNIKYVSDKKQFGLPEFWQLPSETLSLKKGDCEDGAILMANFLTVLGVPSWKIRLTAGLTTAKEGHAWLTYYCSKTKRWVALDWCYHPSDLPIQDRLDYKDTGLYAKVWFSWTRDQAYFGDADKWSRGGGEATYTLKHGRVHIEIEPR